MIHITIEDNGLWGIVVYKKKTSPFTGNCDYSKKILEAYPCMQMDDFIKNIIKIVSELIESHLNEGV